MLFQPLLWPLCESMFLVIRHYSSQKFKNLWNSNIITGWDWWSALLCSGIVLATSSEWISFFQLQTWTFRLGWLVALPQFHPPCLNYLFIVITLYTHTHTHMLSLTSNLETNLIFKLYNRRHAFLYLSNSKYKQGFNSSRSVLKKKKNSLRIRTHCSVD
jgi:hypothetical protein